MIFSKKLGVWYIGWNDYRRWNYGDIKEHNYG